MFSLELNLKTVRTLNDKPSFIFTDQFNGHYINELYDGDYEMVEDTFADVLKEYDPMLEQIRSCYHQGDIAALKSAVHKMKPLIGYVGLTDLQAQCLSFENACQQGFYDDLNHDYAVLTERLVAAKPLIEAEKKRLSQYRAAL